MSEVQKYITVNVSGVIEVDEHYRGKKKLFISYDDYEIQMNLARQSIQQIEAKVARLTSRGFEDLHFENAKYRRIAEIVKGADSYEVRDFGQKNDDVAGMMIFQRDETKELQALLDDIEVTV